MSKWVFKAIGTMIVSAFCYQSALAADLIQVYQQALANDPTYKNAEATWLAGKQAIPISRAAFLPTISSTGSITRTQTSTVTPTSNSLAYESTQNYALNLQQSIFNMTNWAKLKNAQDSVKQAAATYSAAEQDLILRTATAYFGVLQANDDLRFTLAEKQALYRQLQQTQQQYKVGLIAVTGVYQAQAKYDGVVANEIVARNTLADKLEQLREITGVLYPGLAGLKGQVPLIKPDPIDSDLWVQSAERYNYQLLAARYAMLAAKDNIKVQETGHLPTVTANGSYSYGYTTNTPSTDSDGDDTSFEKTRTASLGATINLPVYTGGLVTAQTKQAMYQYESASAQLEQAYRSTVSAARQAYLGVLAGISQIMANRQTVASDQSALKATQAAYIVGTQTMLDVLNVQSQLYNDQRAYSQSQYQYILTTLQLKEAAGTLGVADLQKINQWLGAEVNLKSQHPETKFYTSQTTTLVPSSRRTNVNAAPATLYPHRFQTSQQSSTVKKRVQASRSPQATVRPNQAAYTIQLMTDPNEAKAQSYILRNHISEKAWIEKGTANDKPIYQVLYGHYADAKQADAALNTLPQAVKNQQPRIRKIV